VRTSVRRIHFTIASGCPSKDEFELAYIYLQRAFSSGRGAVSNLYSLLKGQPAGDPGEP
jgi:hypothetical protein